MKNPSSNGRPLSPRRRKLRLTLALLVAAGFMSAAVGSARYWLTRPARYAPGEASADVSSELSKKLPGAAPKPLLVDVTRPSGLAAFSNFSGRRTSQLPEDMGPGLAWGDYDNDGDEDLFLVSAGGALNLSETQLLPCELHENLGNGVFRRSAAFPELRIRGMGAAWGDADNDGDLDLAVSAYDGLCLFRNEGLSFVRDSSFPCPKGFWTGISWGDYDNDRDLDLYVCGYVQYVENEGKEALGSDQLGTFVPYTLNPASYKPGLNMLLRNNGDGSFTDVAEVLGVTNPAGRSLCGLWHDFDDDGWLDLYVANDISDNVFFHNVGGRFVDISHPAWVADYRSAMGLAAGDYDRDGDDDLFITHWVAQENALYENHFANFMASPATNASRLRFTDVNEMRGLGQLSLPFVGWGTEFADFDGDGWLDLVVANGSTIEEPQSNPKTLKPQHAFLFWNEGGQFFHDLSEWNGSLSEAHVARGLALADYDNDGDLDLALARLGEGVQLLRNDMQKGNWLELKLRDRTTGKEPGFGDGAKVLVHAGGAIHRRTVSSASYLSQSSRILHFGLGTASRIDRIEVRWLGGTAETFENLASNARFKIIQGGQPRRLDAPQSAAADGKERKLEFWKAQRGAMNALKVEKNATNAARLFAQALAIDPRHEDSRYYLAHCLAAQGEVNQALEQLLALQKINPQSHRAFQQFGNLRALSAETPEHLQAAEASLRRARAINPEETGALLLLGEVQLLQSKRAEADASFAAVCATNPRAAGAFFFRAYIAWLNGDSAGARRHLQSTRAALGPEWQPKGSTAEGDVKDKQHSDASPLRRFLDGWNGAEEPAQAFAPLHAHLGARLAARVPQKAPSP